MVLPPTQPPPPHSVEGERGILGSILLCPGEVVPECIATISSPWFYVPAHQTLYNTLIEEWGLGHAIDLITFTQTLRDKHLLEGVGGAAMVTSLFTFVPTATNIAYYLDIVREKWLLREVISRATKAIARAYTAPEEPSLLVTELQNEFLSLGEAQGIAEPSIKTLALAAVQHLSETLAVGGKIPGLTTGLIDLDRMIGGMMPKQLIIIAGETGEGKSALGLNIMEHLAIGAHPAGIISLEMSGEELTERFIASMAPVDMHDLVTTGGQERDYRKVLAAVERLGALPIHIRDDADVDPLRMRAIGRQLKYRHGIELLIVDYIQLLSSAATKEENRERAVSNAAAALKLMAKELGIVVIGLSQLNEAGKLRESRAIGHHADKVLTISHDDEGQSFIHVSKNRRGPVGDVAVTFFRKFTKFANAARPINIS